MASNITNDASGSPDLSNNQSNIKLRQNTGGTPLAHADVDGNFEVLRLGHNAVVTALASKLASSHAGTGGGAHLDATTSVSGFMSSTDKSKLNGITAGANAYTLPAALSGTIGGVKVASNSNISLASDGAISVAQASSATKGVVRVDNSTITISSAGVISAAAQSSYTLPVSTASTLGGVKVAASSNISVDGNGFIDVPVYDAAYEGGGVFGRSLARMGVSYDSSVGSDLIRRDSVAALTTTATEFTPFGQTTIASDDALYVVNGQRTMKIYIHATEGIDIRKDASGSTIAGGYGDNDTQGGLGSYQFRGVVADPLDSRYDTIPQYFINYGQAKAYLQFHHLGIQSVEFWFLTDVTEDLYPYGSGTAPHDAHYFKEKLYSPFQNGERQVKQWNVTFKGGRTFIHYSTANVHIEDLSININSNGQGFSHVSVVTGGGYLYLAGYVGVWADRYCDFGIWGASRQSTIYNFSMGDYRINNDPSNGGRSELFPSYIYHLDNSQCKELTSYGNAIYNHGAYAMRCDGWWGTAKLANGSDYQVTNFNIPHSGSDEDASVMGWPDGSSTGTAVQKTMAQGGSAEDIFPAIGPYTQIVGARQTYDPLVTAFAAPAFMSSGVGNTVSFANYTEFTGTNWEVEPVQLNNYCFTPVMGQILWGSTLNPNVMPIDGFQALLQVSQASSVNFPITIANPIHSVNSGLAAGTTKGRYFHFFKHGYAGGDAFNASTADETSSHATDSNGNSFNRYFPTTPNFHAQDAAWIPTANFA
jgi:hypothetical protein